MLGASPRQRGTRVRRTLRRPCRGKRAAVGAKPGESGIWHGQPLVPQRVFACGGRRCALDCRPGACFGAQGSFLVDFFHLCEHLGEAAKVCAANDPQAWLEQQKDRLKANRADAVLVALAPFVGTSDPATACDRYIRNRLSQLDYHGAIRRGLPIGSGEIESAHRYVIQKRLKLPAAWWTPDNVEAMLALRLNRASREWGIYWQSVDKQAA